MANFKYVEKITTSQQILNAIKDMVTFASYPVVATEPASTNAWTVVNEVADATTTGIKELVLKSTAKINNVSKDFYVRFKNPQFEVGAVRQHSSLTVSILKGFDTVGKTVIGEGHPANFEWADENYQDVGVYTDRSTTTPLYIYANITNEKLAMVVVADPAIHFTDYRKSFFYAGAITPFSYNLDDLDGNVLLTAGSVTAEPTTAISGFYSGQYTSFGNNTFQMLGTKSGISFQKHYPAYITQAPETGKAFVQSGGVGDTGVHLQPQGFNASNWTRRYHLSPCYVTHPYDGYRGQLSQVIAVTKNNILHLDELVVDVSTDVSKGWKSEVYAYFDHNTEANFMNKSANVQMGLALLKEIRYV